MKGLLSSDQMNCKLPQPMVGLRGPHSCHPCSPFSRGKGHMGPSPQNPVHTLKQRHPAEHSIPEHRF